jgi:hypothetical protein
MQNHDSGSIVTGKTVEELQRNINKALSQLYRKIGMLEEKVNRYSRGQAVSNKGTTGEVILVENKSGQDKYKLIAKFKDGDKELDASFKEVK